MQKEKEKKSNVFIIYIIVPIFVIVITIILIIYLKKRNNAINEVRINGNRLNINNNINIRNQVQTYLRSDNIIFEKNLSNEFDRLKIKNEEKICQICKNKNGKYIGDCGCVVCEKHSNFTSIIKDEGKFKICFNCGKLIKNIMFIKNICNICFQEVSSLCHFKCCCTLKVCENCFIKCKKLNNKCPNCRKNI